MNCTQLQNRRIHFEQSERWLNVLLDASLVRMRCSILCYIILSYFKLDQYSNALTIFMQLYRVLFFCCSTTLWLLSNERYQVRWAAHS